MPAAQWILLAVVPGLDAGLTQCVAAALVESQCGTFDPTIATTRDDAGHRCATRDDAGRARRLLSGRAGPAPGAGTQ